MKHTLKISVSNGPISGGIVGYRHINLREKLLRFLLGEQHRLTVIIPGDSVKALSIIEEGDQFDE